MTKREELEKAISLLREYAGKLGDATVKAIAASLVDAYDEMQEGPPATVESVYGEPLGSLPIPEAYVPARDLDNVPLVRQATKDELYLNAGDRYWCRGVSRGPTVYSYLILRRAHVIRETGEYRFPEAGEYIRDANGDVYQVSAPSGWGKGPIYVSENEPSHDNYPKD